MDVTVDVVSSVATEYEYNCTWSPEEKRVFDEYKNYLGAEMTRVELLYNQGPTNDEWPQKPKAHPKTLREKKKAIKELTAEELKVLQGYLLNHTCAPDSPHKPILVRDAQTNECVFETVAVKMEWRETFFTLDQMKHVLQEGNKTQAQHDAYGLAWRIVFGQLLDVAFSLHEEEKRQGKRKCKFDDWLKENVGISGSTARKIREISQILKPYPGFMRLGLSFDEVYKKRDGIKQLLNTPQFADAWKEA